jgi:acetyl esterase/lipase
MPGMRGCVAIVRAIALALGVACAGAADPAPSGSAPPCGARGVLDVRYGSQSDHQVFDAFVPPSAGRHPVVIWIHGGGWSGGDRISEADYALQLVCRGYVVVGVDYRRSWEAPYPAQLIDVRNAIRVVRHRAAELGADPSRVGLWGASAGAHLAAMVGVTNEWPEASSSPVVDETADVQAVVAWWAPTDLVSIGTDWPTTCTTHRDVAAPSSNESKLLGCPAWLCPDAARAASPMTYADCGDPPFLLMSGSADCVVPPSQARRFAERLSAVGARADLVILEGLGHGGPGWDRPAVLDRVDRFLDATLAPRRH